MQGLIVTLDGPAGSGKSTVARLLAKRLGICFLDTGAMYRAVTAVCLDAGLDLKRDGPQVAALAKRLGMWFDWQTDPPRLHVKDEHGERALTDRLRDADVTGGVSEVAAMAPVRQILVEAQQAIGRELGRLVSEGRDQGSVVFADADVKFFLEATVDVRAGRRADELRDAGRQVDDQQIRQAIEQRDTRDLQLLDGPLICPPDAQRIDTSAKSIEQVVDLLEQTVRQRAGDRLDGTGS